MRSLILVLSFILGIAPALADGLQVPGITANGQGQLPSMANGVAPSTIWSATASPVTIDTTTASKIDMTAAWSTVAGGQTASTIISNAMILY